MTSPGARFHPSRAGVINVWDYANEEFVFADGRLVLRGHNGSGKTKALEVLFPFILDGVADSRRLDPFSGENRTMKTNLLYGGQESAHGYVWMEFARPAPGVDATEATENATAAETVTLIVGMRAHRNRDGVRSSFYVTGMRLGIDFGLLTVDSRPLPERQLKETLEPGAHSATATEYREKLDARLFGLGRERYTQLLDLLLALRRPLLAKDLDPGKVSATLAAGLSPVDETLVERAARDFENLAAVQQQFDDITAADRAVRKFLDDYVPYLRTRAKSQLARIHGEISTAAQHADGLRRAAAELGRAERAHDKAVQDRDSAAAEKEKLEARRDVLKSDEAYQEQGELDRRRQQAQRAGKELGERRERLARDDQSLTGLEREAGQLADRVDTTRATVAKHAGELADAADRAGITRDGEGAADTGTDLPTTASARETARQGDITAVRQQSTLVDRAEEERGRAETEHGQAQATVEDRERGCEEAEAELAAARQAAAEELRGWSGRWTGADVATSEDVEALHTVIDALGDADASTLPDTFTGRTEHRRTETAGLAERLRRQVDERDEELGRLRRERAEVAAERDDAPPADDRRPADRTDRPGAPLWRLVRFADDVDADRAAGIEGALYGAGLLTAWLHPTPDLTRAAVQAAEADGYLLAVPEDRRPGGPTLAEVLAPEDQELVPTGVITQVLSSIAVTGEAFAEGPAPTVSTAARFSYGIHLGAHPKPSSDYIGATNRAHRRATRLADYDTRIGEVEQRRETTAGQYERATELLDQFRQARDELPPAKPVLAAHERVARESTLLTRARAELSQRQGAYDTAVAEVDAKRRALRQVAAERDMPTAPGDVDAVEQAVRDFASAARALPRDREQLGREEGDLSSRREAIATRRHQHEQDTAALEGREREHEAELVELRAREEKVDAPLRETLARLEEVEDRLRSVDTEHANHAGTVSRERDAKVRADSDLKHARQSFATPFDALLEHAVSFAPLAHADLRTLLGVTTTAPWPAEPDWPDPGEAATSVARAVTGETCDEAPDVGDAIRGVLPGDVAELLDAFDARLADTPVPGKQGVQQASKRMSTAVQTFQDELESRGEEYRVDHDLTGVVTVHVSDEGGRAPVADFARRIGERAEEQGVLLEERERTVLEDELLGGLTQQIHDRVRTARDLVRGMDEDTRSRPMSSGTRIGIRWSRSDRVTDKQLEVSRLLDRDTHALGPSGLLELRTLLREMIRDYRTAHPRATYRQALSEVLDYRAWYAFELRLAVPGETEVKLTKAKHEEMSGGEKSAAIHLPLFAAAGALYSSAKPSCPRMIALDEAFAGIDDQYKPDLLGLTVTFDLDLFMTGHDLWVRYDSVPMATHYDMHYDKSAHAVSAMLMLWDGQQTVDADAGFAGNEELEAQLLGFGPSRHVPAATDGTLLEDPPDDDEEEGDV